MARKPIIDIDVNSGAFEAFLAHFNEYQKKLEGMPASWKAMNARVAEFQKMQIAAGGSLAGSLTTALEMERAFKKIGHHQQANANIAQRSANAFKSMQLDTMKMSKGILSITSHLMKWGGLVGALGLGAGLFGLDRLADSAMNQQRGARGMNVGIGQAASMKVNMGRFLSSPDQVMSTVANAQQNYSQWGNFAALGLNPAEVAQRGTFGATLQVLEAARRAWKANPNAAMPQIQAAERLGLSLRDIRNISSHGFGAAVARTRSDVSSLGLSGGVASAWSQFSIQLSRAGRQIENTLIGGLAPLAPELTKVSAAINKDLIALLHSPELKKAIAGFAGWIGGAGKDINQFGQFLTSAKFQSDMRTFGIVVGDAATEIAAIVKFLYPYAKFAAGKGVMGKVDKDLNAVNKGVDNAGAWVHNKVVSGAEHLMGFTNPKNNPGNIREGFGFAHYKTQAEGIQKMAALLRTYPKNHHADTLASIIPVWNGHGKNDAEYIRRVAHWSGIGPNQPIDMHNRQQMAKVIAAMSREEGTDHVSRQQAAAAMQKHFASVTPAPAPATAGGAKNGELPASVGNLVRMLRQRQAQSNKYLTITNATAAHVAVSANALAGGVYP